jgi:hypothetical protein
MRLVSTQSSNRRYLRGWHKVANPCGIMPTDPPAPKKWEFSQAFPVYQIAPILALFVRRKSFMGTVQWRPYMHFTAQSTALQAFYLMIARLKKGELTEGEYPCVVVFMAFSIEAYVNTLGSRQISFWDEIERLPWR